MSRWILCTLLCASCSSLGDRAPDTPEIFGPGRVSTRGREFATTFSPDQNTVYVNLVEGDEILLVRSQREGDSWGAHESVPFSDGSYPVVDPFISEDGSRLYFSSSGPKSMVGDRDDFALWYTSLEAGEWSDDVTRIENLDHPGSDVFCTLDGEGGLTFSTRAPETERVLMYARATEAGWEEATRIEIPGLPPDASIGNPLIAPDRSFLIFTSRLPQGVGSVDLYLCKQEEDGWSEPILLPEPINSEWADFAPALSPDGKAFFFTSERPGMVPEAVEGRRPGDIYWVHISALDL